MKKPLKKILPLAAALMLFSAVPAQAAMTLDPQAAPALALEMAAKHGVALTGEEVNGIAKILGTGASFMGIAKSDPMYPHYVMHYLHEEGILDMDEHCEHCEHMLIME